MSVADVSRVPSLERANVLSALAPRLDTSLLDEALDEVSKIVDERNRGIAIRRLLPHLAFEQRRAALDLVKSMDDQFQRAMNLAEFAKYLRQPDWKIEERSIVQEVRDVDSAVSGALLKIALKDIALYNSASSNRRAVVDKQTTTAKRVENRSVDRFEGLPANPAKFWKPRGRGRPLAGASYDQDLIDFIRDVYGSLLDGKSLAERNTVRAYIFRKDKKLYEAILSYENRGRSKQTLPPDIFMPSETDIVDQRIEKVRREGIGSLTKPERRSINSRLVRLDQQNKPKGVD